MQIICHGLKEEDFPVEFTDHKIFIGRDESNSIPVSAEGVSRFHAILIEDGGELFLQDNDSRNGTFLNYKQVRSRQKLVNGDIVQIGYRLIRVDSKPEQDAVVLDFVPPEETEVVSNDSAAVPPDSGEPERTMVASDEIERTMVASETMLSRSSMPDKALLPGGTEIGKYVIIKRLGKGGMGEVYLAKHKTLGICRALKVLSKDAEGGNTRFLERFLREAKLASEIRHPNVVGVMDVETGEDCGFPYIVMEYVDGGSLRNSLTATKRLSEEQAVVIVEAVASALQAAEEHNIVHRDIKPDNIMFTRRGEVKLADLGIAKVDGKDNDFTKTNMMIGTPAYLPPEQAQNAKAVDARADIYSLGATFYEMLTGQQPYPGENSIEVLHKLFLTPVPDPRKINPEVSAASAAIAMKMMAKDPKDRFQNATDLLNMMEKTFPLHTASEAADLVQKAVAGVSQSNASFSSGISSSTLSLWWLKLPNKKFVLPVAGLVFAICVLCILFPFLGKKHTAPVASEPSEHTAPVASEPSENTAPVASEPSENTAPVASGTGGNTSAVPVDGDPLLVTTDRDVVDPNDGVVSLREALDYAQCLGTNAIVSFWRDYTIRLNSALVISSFIIIDGGTHNITIVGPKDDSMFHVSESDLRLKNLTLISDRSGDGAGIMDISSTKKQSGWFDDSWSGRLVELVSVKDGGTARNLWMFENIGVKINGGSHIHRIAKAPRSAIKVFVGSVLEDSILAGAGEGVTDSSGILRGLGNYLIFGSLNNSTVLGATLWIYPGGNCENLTVGQKAFLLTGTGTVNGLKVEFGGLFGYEAGSVLNGTISISGAATAQDGMRTLPTVLPETDLVFDLTERTEGKGFFFSRNAGAQEEKTFKTKKDDPILDDIKAFRGARSYTVQVKADQAPGTYRLAGKAEGFNTPVSLQVGTDLHSGILSAGKSFFVSGRTYTLSLTENNILTLSIDSPGNVDDPTVGAIKEFFPEEYQTAQELRESDPAAYYEILHDLQRKLNESKQESEAGTEPESGAEANTSPVASGTVGNSAIAPVGGSPLLVTTERDVVDPNDGVTSLREAVTYAQRQEKNRTVSFADDYKIRLGSPLAISKDITIDGGKKKVFIIAPKDKAIFSVRNKTAMNLKNMFVLSSGRPVTETARGATLSLTLTAVKDHVLNEEEGIDESYSTNWNCDILKLEGKSHLTTFSAWEPGKTYSVRIGAGSVLENGSGNNIKYEVYGNLNWISSEGRWNRIFVYKGGKCENLWLGTELPVENERVNGTCLVEHLNGGTIDGLKILNDGMYGYEPEAVLTGQVSISGVAVEQTGHPPYDRSIVGRETDIIFDLTNRSPETVFSTVSIAKGAKHTYPKQCNYMIQNMKAFMGARNYSFAINSDQKPGDYILAGNAAGFKDEIHFSTIALAKEDIIETDEGIDIPEWLKSAHVSISVGKSVTIKNMLLTLSLRPDLNGRKNLILTIKRTTPAP